MAKYVLVYSGGTGGSMDGPPDPDVMAAWGAWYGSLGSSVVDGGAPFGESARVGGGSALGLTGYTIIEAADLKAAQKAGEGCPVRNDGGTVDVFEAIDMSGGA
jgi:hypothetical protein